MEGSLKFEKKYKVNITKKPMSLSSVLLIYM